MRQSGDRGGRGGVAAVAVQHDRDPKVGEKHPLHGLKQLLAGRQIAAADKQRGIVFFLWRAREDGAFHQGADIVRRHAAMPDHMIGAAVIGDHGVEHGRMRIRIKLEQ